MGKWLVSEGGLEPPRPIRALAPQASASAIPPLGPARPLYPRPSGRTLTARPAARVARGLTVHGRRVPTPAPRPVSLRSMPVTIYNAPGWRPTRSADLGAIAGELGNRHEARRNFTRVARYGPAVFGPQHPQVRAAQRFLGGDAPVTEPAPEAQAGFAPAAGYETPPPGYETPPPGYEARHG